MYKELDDNFRSILPFFFFSSSAFAPAAGIYYKLYYRSARGLRDGVKLDTFPSIGGSGGSPLGVYSISMAAVTECRSCGSR